MGVFAGLLMLGALFCGCPAGETAAAAGTYPETLIGTRWEWDSAFGLRTLAFDSPDHLIFHNDHRDGTPVQHLDDYYTYDRTTGQGNITGEYPAGPFIIINEGRIMHFTNFKNYGHGADFTRLE